jgi:hypothetical protein
LVEVGPVWSDDHAKQKGFDYEHQNPGWKFTGQWKTIVPGQQSVIEVEYVPSYRPEPYAAPPIYPAGYIPYSYYGS